MKTQEVLKPPIGLFTTAAFFGKTIFLEQKHKIRLYKTAQVLDITLEKKFLEKVFETAREKINLSRIKKGLVKIMLVKSGFDAVPFFEIRHFRKLNFPLRLTISHEKISRNDGLSCFKLLDYTGPIAAFNKAENEGFDEAIRLNEEGEVVSGCLANIFWKYEGKLYTPPLESGCLAGTTREFLMERTGAIEKNASIEDLATAERIYLTSAGLGVAAACLTDANSFEPSDELLTLTPHFGVGKAS